MTADLKITCLFAESLAKKASYRISQALRPSTQRNHRRNIEFFIAFAKEYGLPVAPPQEDSIILFAEYCASRFDTKGAVFNSLSSVRFYCKKNGYSEDIFSLFNFKMHQKGVKLTKPLRQKPRQDVDPQLFKDMIYKASIYD